MLKKIAIYGAGGFGREVLMILQQTNKLRETWDFIGFFDDQNPESDYFGYPILGNYETLNSISYPLSIVIGIGSPEGKKHVFQKIANPLIDFPNIIHPNVQISDFQRVTLGKGNVICGGCVLTTDITIKDFVILNLSCTVGHDAIIESFCSFMPTVNISGTTVIDEGVYIGTGASIINKVRIHAYTVIGAGSVVTRDIPPRVLAAGVPAKVKKKLNETLL